MKSTIVTTLSIILSLSLNAQHEPHPCAEKHAHSKGINSEKTLSVLQEAKANKYDVHYYHLDLNMTNQDTSISGTATINGETIASLDSIILELDQNFVINDLRLNSVSTNFDREGTALKIPINASAAFEFSIEIDYEGTAPPIASNPAGVSGVYSQFVTAMNDRITFTVSTPFYAHQWFPVKQILRDKADSSTVILTVPSNCKAASNGVLVSEADNGNGTSTFHWNNTHPVGYNLIFAAIAPFQEYNDLAFPSQLGGTPVEINSYLYGSGTTLTNMQAQCDLIPGFLEIFSEVYGLYPFSDQRYGILAAPFGGGMEHQTMPTIGTFEKKVTAHELCHQWWGDKVGFASFSDIWLSEGFATYSEYLMLEYLYPSELTPLILGWHSNVKSVTSGSVYHTDTLNLYRIYDSRLSYRKAASVIHTLREIVDNDALFFAALRTYLDWYQDTVASTEDFKTCMEILTFMDHTAFFDQWIYGQGFPKYSTIWNSVGNDLYLEISHTASYPSATPTFTNPIEIRFTRASGVDTTIRFPINSNQDQFFISGIGEVTGIGAIDPNNWVINNNGTNTNDPSFVGLSFPEQKLITIYPNPVRSNLTIELPQGKYQLRIVSSLGSLVHESLMESSGQFDLQHLKKDNYHIILTDLNTGNTIHREIVKM